MRYVILGNGPAGVSAFIAAREADPHGEITIVSPERHRYYSKILLTYWIGGKVPEERLFLADEDFYVRRRANTLLGVGAVSIDCPACEVVLADGRRIPYDRLLLAMGSSPDMPDIPGADLAGVHCLRTLDDAKAIADSARAGGRAIVIGGGLVGLKTAEAFLALGRDVALVVSSKRMLSQITSDADSEATLAILDRPKVRVLLGCDVLEIGGRGRAEWAKLSTGETLECGVVVAAKGVSPNTSMAADAGIRVNRGVLVNDRMETSVPGVFAAGDLTEAYDISRGKPYVNGLWSKAVTQGRIAGYNMAGREVHSPGYVAWNSVTFDGECLASIGRPREEPGDEVLTFRDPAGGYRRLVLRDGRLVGAVLMGAPVRTGGVLLSLVQRMVNAEEVEGVFSGAPVTFGRLARSASRLGRPVK